MAGEYLARRPSKLQGILSEVRPLITISHSKHHRSYANRFRVVSLSTEPQSHGKSLAQIVLPVMMPRLTSGLQ